LNGLRMPNAIRDAAPDAWGRRIILNRKFGAKSKDLDTIELDELAFLLESGSDRVGALDFQESAEHYKAREGGNASLDELSAAAERVEKGIPLTPELGQALLHGTSIGGARPKTTITSDDKKYVAKFSSQNDVYSVVKAEYIAMRLAGEAGLNVAPVHLERAAGKDVLLVERFDREKKDGTWARKMMVSALTLLELDEMMGRYASYENLATIVRHRFTKPKETLRELYSRMVFNVLCGNTDDHARNHAAFWDGTRPTLTPAYDLCPQARSGAEATQAHPRRGKAEPGCALRKGSAFVSVEQRASRDDRQKPDQRHQGTLVVDMQGRRALRGRQEPLLAAAVSQSVRLH
jgi:serine/threonine-protein kinase HipA